MVKYKDFIIAGKCGSVGKKLSRCGSPRIGYKGKTVQAIFEVLKEQVSLSRITSWFVVSWIS